LHILPAAKEERADGSLSTSAYEIRGKSGRKWRNDMGGSTTCKMRNYAVEVKRQSEEE